MDNTVFTSYLIEDRSYIAFIKREIHNKLIQAGFPIVRTGEIDIIVSELATNLIKHANGGEFIFRIAKENGSPYFEIYSIDAGPGTNNIAQLMKDGVSSTNTLGQGLGAISRFSDVFQIYSMDDWGTVAYSKVCLEKQPATPLAAKKDLHIAPLQLCIPSERVCGDSYFVKRSDTHVQIFMGDGLGHGPNAEHAVQTAVTAFKECNDTSPARMLRYIDTQVKKTRGLVGTVAVYDKQQKQWQICGIGNIGTKIYAGLTSKNYMPHNGIIGLNIPNTLTDFTLKEEGYHHIIMFSDGLKSRFDINKYPVIFKYDSPIIAAALFKDNARRTDDMTILVGKVNF